MTISLMRSFADDIALAGLRGTEASAALRELATDPAALRATREVLASGATFDDPAQALLHLAARGQRGMLDGVNKAGAMQSILTRAASRAPSSEAHAAVTSAQDAARSAHQLLEDLLYGAPQHGLADVASQASQRLADAVRMLPIT